MTRLHPTDLEILSEAHEKLDKLGSINPVQLAEGDIADVVQEAKNVPPEVQQALSIVESADSVEDAKQAAKLLEKVLDGTAYDPNNPESHHPCNL